MKKNNKQHWLEHHILDSSKWLNQDQRKKKEGKREDLWNYTFISKHISSKHHGLFDSKRNMYMMYPAVVIFMPCKHLAMKGLTTYYH